MKCQNCGSTDIIDIQGQKYCINCGQQVIVSTSKDTPKKPAKNPAPATAQAKAPTSGHTLNLKPMPENDEHPERIKPHPWRFTTLLSLLVAVPVGLAVTASLGLKFDRDISLYLLVTAVLATSTSLVLAQAALMFGLSKNQDGRMSSRAQWWTAARSGFMDLLNLDLMSIIGGLLIIGAGFGAVAVADVLPAGWLKPAFLIAANSLLIWVLFGLFIARRMAIPAVVVGGLTAWQSFKTGWRAYLRFGGRLAVASVETVLIRISATVLIAACILALVKLGSSWSQYQVAIAAGAATAVVIFILFLVSLQVELRLWLAHYRFWVPAAHLAGRARLLGGRRGK